MSARRKAMRAKIAALRAKTTASGCTEAEALAAAELAAELMRTHGIDPADLDMVEDIAPEKTRGENWHSDLMNVIPYSTNTAPILKQSGWNIVGREPGPEIAAYLFDLTVRAVEGETRNFKKTALYRRKRKMSVKRAVAADFRTGMVAVLKKRLVEVFGSTISDDQALLAEQARSRFHGQGEAISTPKRAVAHSNAFFDGRAAGQKVHLSHGIGGSAEPERIGRT